MSMFSPGPSNSESVSSTSASEVGISSAPLSQTEQQKTVASASTEEFPCCPSEAPQELVQESQDKSQSAETGRYTTSRLLLSVLAAVFIGILLGVLLYSPVNDYILAHPTIAAVFGIDLEAREAQASGLTAIYECSAFLQMDFYRKLSTRELLNGANNGINALFKSKKIYKTVSELPDHLSEKQMTERFTRQYKQLVDTVCQKSITPQDLCYAALKGMAVATGDLYTTALAPEEYAILQERLGDEDYAGVGIYLESDIENNHQLTVVEPIDDSPAFLADVRPGDKIMKIDGASTKSMDIEKASALIRGPEGTKVTITFQRKSKNAKGSAKAVDFSKTISRKKIHVGSVKSTMLQNQIGYLRLRFFGPETSKEFSQALAKLSKQGAKGYIVDVRNNGGGYIEGAIGVVSCFVDKGKVVTTLINPRISREEEYDVETSQATHLPVVLLTNRFSASASEIVAGALQDHNRALIVGEKTYGKGSVQSIIELSDHGALKYTIAHYMTPSNKDIHLKGIKPDVQCIAEPTNKIGAPDDKQLNHALREIVKLIKLAAMQR